MSWHRVKLAQVTEVASGFGFPRECQGESDQEFPFFKVGDMNTPGNEVYMTVANNTISRGTLRKLKARAFPRGTVIFPKIGAAIATNKKRILTCPSVVDNNVMGLIPSPLLESMFIYYWMQQFDLSTVANIGPVPSMRKSEVEQVELPLPTLTEQRRIVEILDQAAALRQQRRAADEKAQRILPALFYHMFGDPATNPMGWPAKPIGEMVDPILRRDPSIQPHKPFLYIDIAGVNGSLGIIANANEVMGAEAPSRARQIVRKNDVIISTVRPYLRATALVPSECDNQICSTGFCVLRAKNQQGFGFLYALSRLQWFTDQLNARARGASYPAVTDADILNLRVPQPTGVEAIESFDRQVLDVLMLQEKRSSVGDCIESQCEVLLHRAFSGELTAKWREAHREELEAEMQAQAQALADPAPRSSGRSLLAEESMNDELRPATSSLLKSYQELERLSRSAIQPHEANISLVKQSMELTLQQQHALNHRLSRQFLQMDISTKSIFEANDHWRKIIKEIATASPGRMLLADFCRPHSSWLKNNIQMEQDMFAPLRTQLMHDQLAQLRAATQLSIGSVACRLTMTERAFAGLDLRAMTRMAALAEPSHSLRDSIAQMTARYASLAESIRSYPDFTRLPSFAVPGATRELFVTGYALKTRFPPVDQDEETEACQAEMVIEVEQETSICVSLLQSLDPALARPFLGARQALDASNPDRVRHVLASLRELWNHVLHRLAPDSDVLAWIPLEAKDLLHEGRPTRRARALYICRDLNHPPLADFLDQDTKALVKLVEFFNHVHELDSPITEKQLRAILLRTESWLTYILQLRDGAR